MFQQRSLFPDGFELHEQALLALRELDVRRATALLQRARAVQPRLVDLDPLEEALRWLAPRVGTGDRTESAAALLPVASAALLEDRLSAPAAAFVDLAAARCLALRDRRGGFVDARQQVPWALVDLLQGDAGAARAGLLELLRDGRGERADLWGWLGDAAFLVQRADEAGAAYGRALLLGAAQVDCARLRHPHLLACFARLRAALPLDVARESLLATAWIEGVLRIPAGNGWLDAARVEALATGATAAAGGPAARMRRFGLLLYADRSAAGAGVDLARREEMAALAPELFARFVAACRERERAPGNA